MSDSGEPAKGTGRWTPLPTPSASFREQLRPAVLSVLVLTLLAGFAFPVLLFVIARPLVPRQADGSLVTRSGAVIGSELIGQQFTRPAYFQSRPSAAGNGYDGTASGGTNLGPNNPMLRNGATGSGAGTGLGRTFRRPTPPARHGRNPPQRYSSFRRAGVRNHPAGRRLVLPACPCPRTYRGVSVPLTGRPASVGPGLS